MSEQALCAELLKAAMRLFPGVTEETQLRQAPPATRVVHIYSAKATLVDPANIIPDYFPLAPPIDCEDIRLERYLWDDHYIIWVGYGPKSDILAWWEDIPTVG